MGKNEKSEKKGSHLDRCSRFISLCVYERRRLRGFRFIPRMRAARCRHKHHEVVEVERGVREPPVDEEDVVDAEEDEPRPPDTSAPRPRGALAAVLRSDFMMRVSSSGRLSIGPSGSFESRVRRRLENAGTRKVRTPRAASLDKKLSHFAKSRKGAEKIIFSPSPRARRESIALRHIA